MVSKTQTAIPPPPPPPPPPLPVHLETIFEESSSSQSSSNIDIHYQLKNRQNSSAYKNANQTIHGLISARSIPSVDVQRRTQLNDNQRKLPIEVRFRDGTKRFIQPLAVFNTNINSTPINKRKSSHQNLPSIKGQPTSNSTTTIINTKKSNEKPGILLTVITAEELSEAGVTPTSTSSPDESYTLALVKTYSNSSLDTIQTVKDISIRDPDEVPQLSVQPVLDTSYTPANQRHQSQHAPQSRLPQQISDSRSRSLPPAQVYYLSPSQTRSNSNQIPPVAVVPPSPKIVPSSIQITLTKNNHQHNSSAIVQQVSSIKSISNESKQSFRPSATILVGGGSRSAFRPFLKSTNINSQTKVPSNNTKSQTFQSTSSKSQQSTFSSNTKHFPLQTSITINQVTYDPPIFNSDKSKPRIKSLLSNQTSSDKVMHSTSKKITSNHHPETTNATTHTLDQPSYTNSTESNNSNSIPMISVDPTLPWHSITSKSLYDVPRLSSQYSDIPLRIIIPDGTPTHNQKLLHKHDTNLEKRLLNAGLSPETIALYERILEVANTRQGQTLSPPEILDQYFQKSLH